MIVLVSFLLILLIILARTSEFVNNKYVVWTIAAISLYWGFSYIDAPDTENYMDSFDYMSTTQNPIELFSNSVYHLLEPGFVWLEWLIKHISTNYYVFQFIVFAIEMVVIYIGLFRLFNKKRETICFLCAFGISFSLLLSAFRQGIAIAFFIYSLPYLRDRTFKVPIILFAIASLFHGSSVILYIILAIHWLNPTDRWHFKNGNLLLAIVFIFCNIAYFSGFSLATQLGNLISTTMSNNTLSATDFGKYAERLNDEANFGVLKTIEIDICYIIFFFTKWLKKYDWYNLFTILFLAFFVPNMIAGGITIHRLTYYFQITQMIILFYVLVNLLMHSGKMPFKNAAIVVFLYESLMFMINGVFRGEGIILEYHLFDLL